MPCRILYCILKMYFVKYIYLMYKDFETKGRNQTILFSSHWQEKIVFSRQFVDVLNPFIGCQQNWSKNTIFIMYIT